MIKILAVLFIFFLGYITGAGASVKRNEKNERKAKEKKRNMKERIKSWLFL